MSGDNVFQCLECKHCLPPSKRIGGHMCERDSCSPEIVRWRKDSNGNWEKYYDPILEY